MAAVTICSDFGAQKSKVWHCFHCFPIYFPWRMGLDAMIFIFWMLSFKPTFSLSFFTFIKWLFSSSLLSAIRVVSSVYLRLLIFLPEILIPACVSSSPALGHENWLIKPMGYEGTLKSILNVNSYIKRENLLESPYNYCIT